MKEELIVLGTGHAVVTKCYNTCFALQDEAGRYFLVDTGGGNGILVQLEKAKIPVDEIHHIFLTHEHTDHVLGILWLIRVIGSHMLSGKYQGKLHIYCHEELAEKIKTIAGLILMKKVCNLFGTEILLEVVTDGQEKKILDYAVLFFDIRSNKAKQFGFTLELQNGKKLSCCGDEPYQEHCRKYVEHSHWLFHEAFCLYGERDIFKPYEKCHSTAKDACQIAKDLQVENVVLWHTEDKNIRRRKSLYKKEGRNYFKGGIFVPYDLERIEL